MLGVDACEFGGQVLELLWLTVCYRGLFADKKDLPIGEDAAERNLNYNPPALKSLEEILEMDKGDRSLVKYKETLLGLHPITDDPTLPNVQVSRMALLCADDPEPIAVDLTGDQEKCIDLNEGVTYRIKINFKVNRDIVSGLKYYQEIKRNEIAVSKMSYMVGSFGPKAEEHEFVGPCEETPRGFISRGTYEVKSIFLDDDKNVHMTWRWQFSVGRNRS
ncbi:rho GDP-dissociation inhibitor 3 [Brachionichthys hirsutus]|uniref:rho GDP-dissociation inhibitor 3 n=1 Tax=Brachionichthys hirsutus TaxID=412623 RepID=UPI003604FF50